MAEFITREAIVDHIARIIKEAEKEIVLISPFVNADQETEKLIADTTRSVTIHVIYGKREKLRQNERGFFDERSVKLSYRKDLHAKCYLNEKEAILTSMNLYEYSQRNNDEMGILVSKKDDRELYEAIYKQAMEWKEDSSGVDAPATGRRNSKGAKTQKEVTPVLQAPKKGFCIRCRANLPVSRDYPHCDSCHWRWNRFKNEEYEEKYCHTCGNEYPTTKARPVCLACYRKYKDVLEFAAS